MKTPSVLVGTKCVSLAEMAGTRLLLTSVALLQLLLLSGSALYFGLRSGDVVLIRLLGDARSLLLHNVIDERLAALQHEDTWMVADPVLVTVSDVQEVSLWESIIFQKQHEPKNLGDNIVVRSAEDDDAWQAVCSGKQQQELVSMSFSSNVYICSRGSNINTIDSSSSHQASRLLLLNNGSLAFFPQSISSQAKDWQDIYPSRHPPHTQLDVIILLHEDLVATKRAKVWLNRILNQWLPRQELDKWPCLGDKNNHQRYSNVHVQIGNLDRMAQRMEMIHSNNNDATATVYQLPLDAVASVLGSDGQAWRATLYVSNLDSNRIVLVENQENRSNTTESRLAKLGADQWFTLLDNAANGQAVVDELFESILAQCLGVPEAVAGFSPRVETLVHTNGAAIPPQLYWKLWYQRQVQHMYWTAVSSLVDERLRILSTSRSVAVTEEVANTWLSALKHIELARHEAAFSTTTPPLNLATTAGPLERLRRAQELLTSLKRNPTLSEPLDLSLDHYAGVFIPLLVPILLPLLLGLAREVRRYRRLERKRKDNQQKQQQSNKEKLD
jgi:hypothetical protein